MPPNNADYHDVIEFVSEHLTTFVEEGRMQLPVTMAMVGTNGSYMSGRYTMSKDPEFYDIKTVRAYEIRGGMQAPIHVLMVDMKGRSEKFMVDQHSRVQR